MWKTEENQHSMTVKQLEENTQLKEVFLQIISFNGQ